MILDTFTIAGLVVVALFIGVTLLATSCCRNGG